MVEVRSFVIVGVVERNENEKVVVSERNKTEKVKVTYVRKSLPAQPTQLKIVLGPRHVRVRM